jgi:hypothetical protein
MGREDNLSGQSRIKEMIRRLTGVEPEPLTYLPIPQVSRCPKVSETKPKTNPGPKRPGRPERDKTGKRTGPSQTGQERGEKRKTPNFARPGFVTILTPRRRQVMRVASVITAIQAIEIGHRKRDRRGDHPPAPPKSQIRQVSMIIKVISAFAFLPVGK